ncbi:MAG: accessory gene regulator B family protein [Oscillospiraceae bacterium]|nr:accessory gene regulator B family protein [Oscillospiraceae bacterium]
MFTSQIKKLVNKFTEQGISRFEDEDSIVYGLSLGIEISLNIITTIILGVAFNLVLESFIFVITFSLLRGYVGGYHCEKSSNCYFLSIGIVVLVLIMVKFILKEYMIMISIVLSIFSLPIILKLAPSEAKHKPLDHSERIRYRKKSMLYLFIEFGLMTVLFLLKFYNLGFIICMSISMSAVSVFLNRGSHIKLTSIKTS